MLDKLIDVLLAIYKGLMPFVVVAVRSMWRDEKDHYDALAVGDNNFKDVAGLRLSCLGVRRSTH